MSGVFGDGGIIGGKAGDKQDIGLVVCRTATNFGEKPHRAWRVCQCRQPGMMQGGNQKAGGNRNRFRDVVILAHFAIGRLAFAFTKNADQPGGGFQKRFGIVGAKRTQALSHSSPARPA